ncbi:hypothetical protein Tco_0578022 [Tanacetum coccineum]
MCTKRVLKLQGKRSKDKDVKGKTKDARDKRLSTVDSKTLWIKSVPIKVNILTWKIKIDGLPTRFFFEAFNKSKFLSGAFWICTKRMLKLQGKRSKDKDVKGKTKDVRDKTKNRKTSRGSRMLVNCNAS